MHDYVFLDIQNGTRLFILHYRHILLHKSPKTQKIGCVEHGRGYANQYGRVSKVRVLSGRQAANVVEGRASSAAQTRNNNNNMMYPNAAFSFTCAMYFTCFTAMMYNLRSLVQQQNVCISTCSNQGFILSTVCFQLCTTTISHGRTICTHTCNLP